MCSNETSSSVFSSQKCALLYTKLYQKDEAKLCSWQLQMPSSHAGGRSPQGVLVSWDNPTNLPILLAPKGLRTVRYPSEVDVVNEGCFSPQVLRLANNRIRVIEAQAFSGLQNMNELILTRNEIRDLQPRTFVRLPNMVRLDLGNNMIPALFPLMFKGSMQSLEELSLNDNPIVMIGEAAFSSMSALKVLYLGDGHLRYLKANMFKGLDKLQILQMDYNYISYLQDELFKYMPSLKSLSMIGNMLSTVNPCAFVNITEVKEIRVVQNPIVCTCALQWAALEAMPLVAGRCVAPSHARGMQAAAVMNFEGCDVIDVVDECKKGAAGTLATAVDPDRDNPRKMQKYIRAITGNSAVKREGSSLFKKIKERKNLRRRRRY